MLNQVFVSYKRQDYGFVHRLVEDLIARGVNIWLDQRQIQAGKHWDTEIQNALHESQFFLVVLSASSVQSDNVLDELSFALSNKRQIFPVLYTDCEIPFRLARIQRIDFRSDYNAGLQNLIEQMRWAGVPMNADVVQPAPTPLAPTNQTSSGTNKRPTWQWVAGCISVALVVCAATIFVTWFAYRAGVLNLPAVLLPDRPTPKFDVPVPPTTEAPPLTWTPTPTIVIPNPGPTEAPPPTRAPTRVPTPALPEASNFRACASSCNGQNSSTTFTGGATRIYLEWDYENIPRSADYIRLWTNNGEEWIRYHCNWDGPRTGTEIVQLTEPGGLRSGVWEMVVIVDGTEILRESLTLFGGFDYWDPAGLKDTCRKSP
jgi:hypothetical protein